MYGANEREAVCWLPLPQDITMSGKWRPLSPFGPTPL
jgi:hypothetical protein